MERTAPTVGPPVVAWWRTWLLVAGCGLVGILLQLISIMLELESFGQDPPEVLYWVELVDLIVGLVALGLVVLVQRYRSVPMALLLVGLAGLSAVATLAAVYAVARTVATAPRRATLWIIGVAVASGVGGYALTESLLGRSFDWWIVPLTVLVYGSAVVWGLGSRSRADTLRALRREAEAARREQQAVAQAQEYQLAEARLTERTRLARDVHDALSHELALISMHAGALEFRDDLSPEQRSDATAVVAAAARRAGSELRRVIGALRDNEVAMPPSLKELPELLAELRAAGMSIDDQIDPELPAQLPVSLSQQLHRSARECLRNAQRHAPDSAVVLRIISDGRGLLLECRNPLGPDRPATTGTGTGLLGLAESARLQQGRFDQRVVEGEFVVRMWLPWQV